MLKKTTEFDALIVYSRFATSSAIDQYNNNNRKIKSPFARKKPIYNDSYSYFLKMCKTAGLRVALTTSKDIVGAGLFQSFWTYQNGWVRNFSRAHSGIIFDRFSQFWTAWQKNWINTITSSGLVRLFNNQKIAEIFQDKLKTYNLFPQFSIPTVAISNLTISEIITSKKKLDNLTKNHKFKIDFSSEYLIKDRNGLGGSHIFKVDMASFHDLKKNIARSGLDIENKTKRKYIIQPFIDCCGGFSFGKYRGLIDLRLIILNQKIIQTYIRIAKKGDFKCNEHQGGDLVYMSIQSIPKDVLNIVGVMVKEINKFKLNHTLFTLDFIKSRTGNLFFVEGNSKPGIDWDHEKKINEIKSKELINYIIGELKLLVQES